MACDARTEKNNPFEGAALKLIPRGTALTLIGAIGVVAVGILVWRVFADRHAGSATSGEGAASAASVRFSDETLALGALAEHRQGDDHLTGLDEALGSGACALDYDNDGWIDLFVVNGSGDTRYYGRRHWWQKSSGHSLLRNRGKAQFEDVSDTALVSHPMRGFGCVAADFDNDGRTDVLVTGIDENLMLRNLGNGKFLDITEKAGLKGYGWQTAAAVADVDGDGLLDIYVGRLIAFQKGAHTYEPGSQYKQDVPGAFNSALYPAQPKSLYRNLGGFRFEDVAEKAGVLNADGRTLGALWVDLNADDRPDLIVANAAGTGSTAVFRNEGRWHFTALGTETRLQAAAGTRAPALGDLDNDGVPEILLTSINGAQSTVLVRDNSPTSDRPVYIDRGRQWEFARDEYSGFSPWSAIPADFDNDGWLDVFVANGLTLPDPDVPRLTVGQPKQLYLNTRHGELRAQTFPATDPLRDRQSARGVVAADFDNDGDVDLYVTHNNDLGQLLINRASAGPHWVGLTLVDTEGNRDAVGARVELSGSGGDQYRWATKSMGFLSGSDPRLHFGLGKSPVIDSVVVTWPDGDTSRFRDVPADQYVTLTRGKRAKTTTPKAPEGGGNYAALAHGREPALRADYLRLLVEARGLQASLPEIRSALADDDAAVRKSSVEILGSNPSRESLAILLDSLSDSSPDIVVSAVQAVCKYEEEDAARWLLRLFAHSSAPVRTAVADCFAFYFQEEEAVVHRKYLSIPYLVEALADSDEKVQIASARALGNAERFRGVPPMLELARTTRSAAVRQEAIRAVGLVRDKQATTGLLALLDNRTMQADAGTVAQLLIALRRLGYSTLDAALADFSTGRRQFAGMPLKTRIAVLQELLTSEDGVVIAREKITEFARKSYTAAGSPTDEQTVLALVNVLREAQSRETVPMLASLASSGSTAAVKAAALQALIAVDPSRTPAYIEQGIEASDPSIGADLLKAIAGTRADLSDRALIAALSRPQTRDAVLTVVRRVRSKAAADAVFNIVADKSATPAVRAAALDALTRSPYTYTLPQEIYATTNEPLALAVVDYDVSRLPPLVVSRTAPPAVGKLLKMRSAAVKLATIDALTRREEFWAKSSVLDVLKDTSDATLRAHVLQLVSRNALEGSQFLEEIARNRADPLRIEALRHLEGREGSSAEQLLLSVLNDAGEDPHARVVAAHRLVGRLGPDVLKILEQKT